MARHFRKSSGPGSNYLRISALAGPGMIIVELGGQQHSHADFIRTRVTDPAWVWIVRGRHPPVAGRAGAVERLSAAAMGHRRLSGTLVRRLSGPQPLHRVRPLSAFRRGFVLLDQSRHPGAGDAVDPATGAARVRHAPAVAADGDQPRAGPDHGAALARHHAADRHLYRPVGAGAVHPGRAREADFRR